MRDKLNDVNRHICTILMRGDHLGGGGGQQTYTESRENVKVFFL